MRRIEAFLFLLLRGWGIALLVSCWTAAGREYRIASSAWLTFQGKPIDNDDLYTSFMLLPIAINHFNARNGSIIPAIGQLKKCTATLKLVGGIQDTAGLPSVGMEQLLDAYNTYHADIVHGPTLSNVAQMVGITGGALDLPMLSYSATAVSLSDKGVYPTFFRNVPSDGQFAEALGQLFEIFKFKKVGMLNPDDAFGQDFRDAVFAASLARRITLRSYSYDHLAQGAVLYKSVKTFMKALIKERISVIFYTGLTFELDKAVATAANELNWIEGRLYISRRDTLSDLFTADNDAATNVMLQRFLAGSLNILRAYDLSNPNLLKLNAAYSTFSVDDVNPFLPNGTMPSGASYKIPNDFFQRDQSRMRKYRNYPMMYDSVMTIGLAACGSGPTLKQNLARVNFLGTTGWTRFDSTLDRDSSTLFYALENIVLNSSDTFTGLMSMPVGSFENSNWTFTDKIVFSDGSTTPPLDISPPTNVIDSIPLGAKILGWVEAGVGMAVSLWALLYVVNERKSKVFINAQPVFMALLIIGCVFMAGSIIPLTVETDAGCMLFPWLFSTGFVLSLASLTAKSIRVAVLWYGQGPVADRNHLVRARVLLTGVLLVILVQLSIMSAWQVVAPLQMDLITTQTDADGFPLSSSMTCVLSSDTTISFLALIGAFLCSVMVITVGVSLWVRNAPEKFQEAKMTAVAGLVLFQVFFVGIPTAAVVWGSVLPRFLVLSSIVFVLPMTVLITLFFPKVYNWKFTAWNLVPISSIKNSHQNSSENRESRRHGTSPFSVVEVIDQEKRQRVLSTKATSLMNATTVESMHKRNSDSRKKSSGGSMPSRKSSPPPVAFRDDEEEEPELDADDVLMSGLDTAKQSRILDQEEEKTQEEEKCDQQPEQPVSILKNPNSKGGNLLSTLAGPPRMPPAFFYESQNQPQPQQAPPEELCPDPPLTNPFLFSFHGRDAEHDGFLFAHVRNPM